MSKDLESDSELLKKVTSSLENTLEEIWNGKKYQELRRMHISGNFPKGHKCNEKCDMKKIYQYLS